MRLGSKPRPRAAVALLYLLVLAACSREPPQLEVSGQALGTFWTAKVTNPAPSIDAAALRNAVTAALDRVDGQMSTYRQDSELSRFNASRSVDWFPVSADLVAVMAEAQRIATLSGGALDVTVGPLVNLWGFGPRGRPDRVPQPAELDAARQRVGYLALSVRLDPPALRKAHPDVYVDLSAIAKGFAVDQSAAAIQSLGATDYLVEVGGELRLRGLSEGGRPWRIAIERPVPGEREVEQVVQPGDSGLATSGDYRNYFEVDGKRYSHTIDPATGRPVHHALASVTVIHPSATSADGFATALMVLGPERGMALAEREQLAVLMVVRAGDGFEERSSSTFSPFLAEALQ